MPTQTEDLGSFQVFGPALMSLGPPGVGTAASTSLRTIGVTEGGVTLTPIKYRFDLHTDYCGGAIPIDQVDLGSVCKLDATLIQWNPQVLEVWRGGLRGRLGNAVSSRDIGRLVRATNRFFQLLVQGSARTGGVKPSPYRFLSFVPADASPVTVGTRVSRVQVSGVAFPWRGFTWTRS